MHSRAMQLSAMLSTGQFAPAYSQNAPCARAHVVTVLQAGSAALHRVVLACQQLAGVPHKDSRVVAALLQGLRFSPLRLLLAVAALFHLAGVCTHCMYSGCCQSFSSPPNRMCGSYVMLPTGTHCTWPAPARTKLLCPLPQVVNALHQLFCACASQHARRAGVCYWIQPRQLDGLRNRCRH
jgi:hypothetical protein